MTDMMLSSFAIRDVNNYCNFDIWIVVDSAQ